MRSALVLPAALLVGLALCVGCGPSVQSIHEGNVRFEHCYRLDLEPEIANSHRRACWNAWLNRYTYGQSRDHIEYAGRRSASYNAGDAVPITLDVGSADQPDESRQFYLVVPAPTSVRASPAPIATRVNAPSAVPSAASASAQPLAKAAPGSECEEACKSAFSSCGEACDAQVKGNACRSCDPDYKKCMQRCFE